MKNPGTTILLLVALAAPSFFPAAQDLDSLLVQSIGGPEACRTAATLHTLRARGAFSLNDQVGEFRIAYTSPDKIYLEVTFGLLSLVQAYDGVVAWKRDLNGAYSRVSGYEENEIRRQVYLQSYSYLFDDRLPGGRKYLGLVERDGTDYHLVALTPLNLDTLYLYLDPETARQVMLTSRIDNLETITYNSDFRQVSGMVMPFVSRAVAEQAGLVTEFVVDTVIINQPVDASLYRLPGVQKVDYRFPHGANRYEIPFDYSHGHIYVTASVNGKRKVRLILDSGASANILHQAAITDLDLKVVGSLPTKGIGGYEEADLVRTDSIVIGDLVLFGQIAGRLDLAGIGRSSPDGVPFGGVLGFDFLARFPMMVNYACSTLTVFDPDEFVPPTGGSSVPFSLTMQVPTVDAELDGVSGKFVVDLGNALGLLLHSHWVQSHDLSGKLLQVEPLSRVLGGIGPGLSGQRAVARTFDVGDLSLQDVPVLLPDAGEGITGSEELAGNIGNLLLQNFTILFDYDEGLLIFYPVSTDSRSTD
ncbi:MAG: aspartyl protease family protein [Candidatus Zixiibacteriota bacterium]|nr:MAG: aspartyl protease family protein [candidate division Zixibacteria bacterium]